MGAVVAQAVLALYLQVVEWIPLGRWNNISHGNGQESLDIIVAVIQLLILIVYIARWRWPMIVGLLAYVYWAYSEITSWWVPYVRGASDQWMHVYERWFAHTYKFLPPIDHHPTPDAEHTVLLVLILTTLVLSARAIYAPRRRSPAQ